jgi:hypothetical protein
MTVIISRTDFIVGSPAKSLIEKKGNNSLFQESIEPLPDIIPDVQIK